MFLSILYPYIKFAFGTLYPAYKTWKALKRKEDTPGRRWMKYWVNYGAFQMFELVADVTLAFILPFYILIKLLCILWLVLGTKLIFDSIVNRELKKRERTIDRWLNKISKARDELVARIWYAISRCSVLFFTSLMSGGLSVLAVPVRQPCESAQPDQAETECNESTELEEEAQLYGEPDINKNTTRMDWSAIAMDRLHATAREYRPKQSMVVAVRKSGRREGLRSGKLE